jgi:hypothetical protein
MRFTRLTLTVGLIAVSSTCVFGQRPRPSLSQPKPIPTSKSEKQEIPLTPNRQVTINLKTGAPVTGRFLKADASAIQIEVAGNLLNIKLDDIVSVIFAPEFVQKQPVDATPPKDEDANRALRALRKLAGATQIGINFQEYGSRLIDAKNEVDEATSHMSTSNIKTELTLAMEAYVDAGQAWNQMLRYEFMLPNAEPGLTLIKKYSLEPRELVPGNRSTLALPRNYVLSALWEAARAHIERVESLMNSPRSLLPDGAQAQPLTTVSAASTSVNIVGTWLITLTLGGQSSQTRFVIWSSGDSFRGQFLSPQGTTAVNRIDLTGSQIAATFQDVIDRQRVSIDLSATVEGDAMTGSARVTAANGQSVTVPLSGTRQ